MHGYKAPIEDLYFAITKLADLKKYSEMVKNQDIEPSSVRAIIEEAGKFASKILDPINILGDQQGTKLENGMVRMPQEFIDAFREYVKNGWNTVLGDKKYGGQNLPWMAIAALNEIWESANMSFAVNTLLTQGAVELIHNHGSEKQKDNYLPHMISGEWTGTMNLTEPQAGSDLSLIKSKAEPYGDMYKIYGTKIYITHGDQDMSENIIHLVLARLPNAPDGVRGISLFIVPKYILDDKKNLTKKNDIRVVSTEHKLGMSASPTCVMAFGDKDGAIGEIIGEPNQGLKAMFSMMNNARLNVGIQGIAIAERSFQKALIFSRDRLQGNPIENPAEGTVSIIRHPDIRRMLMEMKSQIEAMRGLSIIASETLDLSKNDINKDTRREKSALLEILTPVLKSWCTDQAVIITSLGIQIHGGMGFIEDTGAAQYYRDARILPIYEGTNGIQALDLLRRKLPYDNGKPFKELLDAITKTANFCIKNKNTNLKTIGSNLHEVCKKVKEASDWLIEIYKVSPEKAAAGATPFCNMLGWTLGGWVMARSAEKAISILQNDENNSFAKEKIETACFYSDTYLPQASAMVSSIINSHKSLQHIK